jgi:site-specific recombinase XerD
MKPTNFSKSLTDFLTSYLPGERGVSHNTILSYKDAFLLFIQYMQDQKGIKVNRLDFNVITKNCIVEYLDWLQKERGCGNSTRNSRLAAMHSFFRYLQYQYPEKIYECQKILSIPLKKKENPIINYLTLDGIKLLLEGPDLSTKRGRRDLALLSLMYDSAARVQEIIDLTPLMVRLDKPCIIKLIGKGAKARIVPLMDAQVKFLKDYIVENKLHEPYANKYPMFQNSRKEKLTRAGLNHILTKYANQARDKNQKLIPEKLSCHSLRHSKAMHLLESGVNLVYIRDILGHTSVQTTEIYARADSQKKREAIERAYSDINPKDTPPWLTNDNLLGWLKEFGR